jgi:SRSO17 transposase
MTRAFQRKACRWRHGVPVCRSTIACTCLRNGPKIALDQISAAVAANVDRGVILADAAYGINTEFRDGLSKLGLQYAVDVQSSMTVWEPGKQPLPAKPRGTTGRPPRLLQRTADHRPVSVKQLAISLPSSASREIIWREAGERKLRSRFAAIRVRPAHRDYWKASRTPTSGY